MSDSSKNRCQIGGLLIASAMFGVLTFVARENPKLFVFLDSAVAHAVVPFQTFESIEIFLAITSFGGVVGVLLISLGALLFLRRQPRHSLELITVLAGTSMTVHITKLFIARARPEMLMWFAPLNTYSFPSGHSASAVALYGFIILLLLRQKPRWYKAGIVICSFAVITAPLSRLVLSVHFASDVLGGIAIAIVWLLIVRLVSNAHR